MKEGMMIDLQESCSLETVDEDQLADHQSATGVSYSILAIVLWLFTTKQHAAA
jgi:hypothetical protein